MFASCTTENLDCWAGVKLVTLALVVIGSRILIPPPLPPWSPFLVIVQTDICLLILFVAVVLFLRLPFPAFLVQPVRKHILNIERSDISTSLLLPSPFNHPACHLSPVLWASFKPQAGWAGWRVVTLACHPSHVIFLTLLLLLLLFLHLLLLPLLSIESPA